LFLKGNRSRRKISGRVVIAFLKRIFEDMMINILRLGEGGRQECPRKTTKVITAGVIAKKAKCTLPKCTV